MVDRPFGDIRPVGPFIGSSDNDSEQSSNDTMTSISSDDLAELKDDIEKSIGMDVSISQQDAKAIYMLDTPMLQSYVSNVLGQASQHSDDVSVESVIKSDATKKYARKVGSVTELENAKSVYS